MTDDEIREFLKRNPDVLREFVATEARRGERWLSDFLAREGRRLGRMAT